ncbi:MAG TPA: hypothetical protein VFU43_07375 [Streptosporangiaceae bacterium]|nr:hypothetical protein [Streptosporangiaceae bacterium]
MGDYAADGSGNQNDLSRYNTPGTHRSANRAWGYSADDVGRGYRVDTDQLNTIAAALEQDLRELETALNRVTSMAPITTQHVSWSRGGTEFAGLAQTAMEGFSQYYQELQTGYRTVIYKLYKSAGNYRKAEEYNTSAAASAYTGSASPGQGPTTDSTGRF